MSSRYLLGWFMLMMLSFVHIGGVNASIAVPLDKARTVFMKKATGQLRIVKGQKRETAHMTNGTDRTLFKKIKAISAIRVDFTDPVSKWLWFGLFGLGISVVLGIFDLGLGGLVALAAVVCLVIWLIKLNQAV